MEMASSLPNPSFDMRAGTIRFPRSISSKETPPSAAICIPPRLSTASISLSPPLSLTSDVNSTELKIGSRILCVAAGNGVVYAGTQGNAVRVLKLPELTECGQLKTKACMVVALQVSSDRVYAAYADCKIRVWCRTRGRAIKHVRLATVPTHDSFLRGYIARNHKTWKHLGPISSMAVNTSDDILYTASLDKTVKIWRISDFKCIDTIEAHSDPINAVAVADDGVLYTASDDATVRVWRRSFCHASRSHSLTLTLPTNHSPVKTLALTSDAAVLYGGCADGYVHYWLKGRFSGHLQHGGALPGHTHAVMGLATVGAYVVSGSADSTSRVWVREAGGAHSCVAVLQGHRGPIKCVAAVTIAGDDGCTVCTGSLDGVLMVQQVKNNAVVSYSGESSSHDTREYFDLP